jgi:hypothetical protein
MSLVGMGNQWGKRTKKERVSSIINELKNLNEKQLILLEDIVPTIRDLIVKDGTTLYSFEKGITTIRFLAKENK